MAKRYTDTDKWSRQWFRKLNPKLKCAWSFICDRADFTGVWLIDFEAMSFHVGETVTEVEFIDTFHEKIIRLETDKLWLKDFIEFQYGTLNPKNKVHQNVLSRLSKYGSALELGQGQWSVQCTDQSPSDGGSVPDAKEEEKEEDKAKEKVKEKEKANIKTSGKKTEPEIDPAIEATQIVIGELNKLLGTNFSPKSKSTIQAIRKILNDKFTLQDIEDVVGYCYNSWAGDEKMSQFLTPDSIFRPTKFEAKLERAKNQIGTVNPEDQTLKAAQALMAEAFPEEYEAIDTSWSEQ